MKALLFGSKMGGLDRPKSDERPEEEDKPAFHDAALQTRRIVILPVCKAFGDH
jgi:hypothetical protein